MRDSWIKIVQLDDDDDITGGWSLQCGPGVLPLSRGSC